MKKSAFNNWSLNLSPLRVTIRSSKVMRCVQITICNFSSNIQASKAISCFSQVSLLVSQNRGGIAKICATHLYILCFHMCNTSYKRINPTGKANIDMIFSLIAHF